MMEQFRIVQQSLDYPSICWEIQKPILITGCPTPSLKFIAQDPVEAYSRLNREVDKDSYRLSTPETFFPVGMNTEFSFLSPLEDPEPFCGWTRFGYGSSYYIKTMSRLASSRLSERFGADVFHNFLDTPYLQMLSD